MPKKYDLRFMHIADAHLGKKQYGLDDRVNDFAIAFEWVCISAVKEDVEFVIISGDLFDKRNVNAKTLQQAVTALTHLKMAGIKVLVIEGNHDRPYIKDKMGWLEYLGDRHLIEFIEAGRVVHYCGVDIYGFGYNADIDEYVKYLENTGKFSIIMLHAGVEGIVPNMGGCLSKEDLDKMKPYCDYLALGHIHRPYDIDGWVHNPGSLEHWNIAEFEWNGGYNLVDVDTKGRRFNVKHVPTPKRPMCRFTVEASTTWTRTKHADNGSIVELTIIGETREKPDIEKFRNNVLMNSPAVFYLKIVDKTTRPVSLDIEHITKDRTETEREVINDMTKDEKMTDLIIWVKKIIDDEPEEILKVIENE
jgi:DNA repair exonuclease SbcCD nuclease subunit